MIGNDIVDWAQAKRESNWQRRGFLDKLFTPHEQQLIYEASHPEQMVWTLWSVKESVYKANHRQTGKREFAPKKIHCQLQPIQGSVVKGVALYDCEYRINATLTQKYISSTAVSASIAAPLRESIVTFNYADYHHQYAQLRQFIMHTAAIALSLPTCAITIQKDDKAIPSLVVNRPNSAATYLPISLSHHGGYGAFVIERSSLVYP